ncbi:MAG: efflux RND transporter periplasmic adaptor subunit [Aquificae bacterium]|nr:efflux RND transporter periplasmic adaptor subunit [Aquificota bacterium]
MLYIIPYLIILIFCQSHAQKLPVTVIKIKETKIVQYYKTNGIIKSDKSVYIKPETTGKVIKLFVQEGTPVKKDQPLIAIESNKYDYQVSSQEHLIKKLQTVYNYKKNLFQKKKILYQKQLISEDEFNLAKLDMETSLQDLKSAQEKLKELKRLQKETVVKAPFQAIVDKRLVSQGDLVNPNTKLLYLVDLTKLKAQFQLPQRFIKRLKIGDKIDIYIEGAGKKVGKITYISSSLSENSLIQYKADIIDKKSLKENMYAVIKILEKSLKGFKIPEKAVYMHKDGNFVYVVENNIVKKRKVEIISQEFGYLFVKGELKNADLVIVSAPFGLKEGKQVQIEEIK